MNLRLLIAVASFLPAWAGAQTLTGVTLEPPQIKAGESVRIVAALETQGSINCGLRVHFGDGSTQDFKVNQEKDIPLVANHVYAKPGFYEIKVEPKRNGMLLRCSGDNKTIGLTVAEASVAAKTEGRQCPEGWSLSKKSVNRKTGAFTCTAKAGTAVPQDRLACPGDLGYFENVKKGELGCRP